MGATETLSSGQTGRAPHFYVRDVRGRLASRYVKENTMTVGFTGRIASAAAARPWLTILGWVLILAAAVAASGRLGDALTQEERVLITTESEQADDLVASYRADTSDAPAIETLVIVSDAARFGDPQFDAVIADTVAAISSLEGIASVTEPSLGGPVPVGPDGRSALVSATVAHNHPEELGAQINDAVAGIDRAGFSVYAYGQASGEAVFDGLAEDTLVRGEMIGIGIALLVLVIVFGALMAAGIPLLVGGISIVTAVGATAIVGGAFDLSFFIVNMISMMGLALGIDYSLVIVQRYREELAHGRTVRDAITIAGNTASRAVLISGATVLVSLAGLLIVPSTIMVSLGTGAMIVAVMAIVTALTLLPAVLALLGHRVNKGRIPTSHPGAAPRVWSAIARTVLKRPLAGALLGLGILLTLAAPALSMRLAFPGYDALPENLGFRNAVETLVEDFGHGQATTVVAVENIGDAHGSVRSLADAIESSPAFAETEVEFFADGAIITTKDVYDAASPEAEEALVNLRESLVPDHLAETDASAYVGGDLAMATDFTDVVVDAAPWVAIIVLGASLLLLLITFRSVVIAGTAIVLNVLSTAAAYGVLVAVFQYGWGAELLGMPHVGSIAPWIPVFLFAVLFGLSMDYHVFLLSRVVERFGITGDTKDAIAYGLSRTGSLITGAALIMVAVFSGFALGDLAEFNQMGLGLAVAVILDATVVRSLLVPSAMGLLGKANWYLPRWLQWLPHLQVEGAAPQHIEEEDARRAGEPALA
jgi:RND superfamily putative drug exporter